MFPNAPTHISSLSSSIFFFFFLVHLCSLIFSPYKAMSWYFQLKISLLGAGIPWCNSCLITYAFVLDLIQPKKRSKSFIIRDKIEWCWSAVLFGWLCLFFTFFTICRAWPLISLSGTLHLQNHDLLI